MKPSSYNRTLILLSPLMVIVCTHVVAYAASHWMGKWAFIPTIMTMWTIGLLAIWRVGGKARMKTWLQPVAGKWGWKLLALLAGFTPITIFLNFYELLAPWHIWVPWLILALVNPWIEEGYWRGVIQDEAAKANWPAWATILYGSVCFATYHPLSYGIFSKLNWGWPVWISLLTMGLIWAISYHKLKSLRWLIVAHFLVDFFNLSVPAFLDLFEPTWGH